MGTPQVAALVLDTQGLDGRLLQSIDFSASGLAPAFVLYEHASMGYAEVQRRGASDEERATGAIHDERLMSWTEHLVSWTGRRAALCGARAPSFAPFPVPSRALSAVGGGCTDVPTTETSNQPPDPARSREVVTRRVARASLTRGVGRGGARGGAWWDLPPRGR